MSVISQIQLVVVLVVAYAVFRALFDVPWSSLNGRFALDNVRSRPDEPSQVVNQAPIPRYVLDHAPLVYLHSEEAYFPSQLPTHLIHTTPHLNYTPLQSRSDHPTLVDLDLLNQWPPNEGEDVFLQSDDDIESKPSWLGSRFNTPNPYPNSTQESTAPKEQDQSPLTNSLPPQGGRSSAPSVLILVEKANATLDAFWFFFYSYNQGPVVLNTRFGNHVGDWEHTLVRFQNGTPTTVFLSEHFFGEAYTFDAMETFSVPGAGRHGKSRPVVYSAIGTHAMYATPGAHPYVLPFGILHDETSKGALWDPSLNVLSYGYNATSGELTSGNLTFEAPTNWAFFNGRWGDKSYPLDDPRQYQWGGQRHYVDGPRGPLDKNLGRRWVCQGLEGPKGRCTVRDKLKSSVLDDLVEKDFSDMDWDGTRAWEDQSPQ